MLFFWHLALTVIKSAIRVIVNLKVTLATCGSLASTVSDSENNDDAFFGPIASWCCPNNNNKINGCQVSYRIVDICMQFDCLCRPT